MDWEDLSKETRETMDCLGGFGPPDCEVGGVAKAYWSSDDLRRIAEHCVAIADWLDTFTEGGGVPWDVVDAKDHDREVTRLQRARARNLVRRMRMLGKAKQDALEKRSGPPGEAWDDFDWMLYAKSRWYIDIADRIAAKCLREVSRD